VQKLGSGLGETSKYKVEFWFLFSLVNFLLPFCFVSVFFFFFEYLFAVVV
jgi:hypothetical protein